MHSFVMSALAKTWVLDLDGTLVKHNGYLTDGRDTLLPGAMDFLSHVREGDLVVFLTSRKEEYREMTEAFLRQEGIPFHHIIYGVPFGERILVNDAKPSGLTMAFAVNGKRDQAPELELTLDESL